MIKKGATTFWEDFDIDWMENTNSIDRFPNKGERDIHGDFGKFCYKNFRHSLCHGWSTGILAFIVEHILGIKIEGGKIVEIKPDLLGLRTVKAKIPLGNKWVNIEIDGENIKSRII